jgi:hypothetical protein
MLVLAQFPSAVSELSVVAFAVISIAYLVLCWLVILRCSSGELIGLGLLTTVASAGYGSIVLPAGPEIAHTMIRIAFLLILGGLVQRVFELRGSSQPVNKSEGQS